MENGAPYNEEYDLLLSQEDYHTARWADDLVSKHPDRHTLNTKSEDPEREIIDIEAYHPLSPMSVAIRELHAAKRRQLEKLGLLL